MYVRYPGVSGVDLYVMILIVSCINVTVASINLNVILSVVIMEIYRSPSKLEQDKTYSYKFKDTNVL